MKFGLVFILACAIISVAVAAPQDKKHKKHGGEKKETALSRRPNVQNIKEFIEYVFGKNGSVAPAEDSAESKAARRRREATGDAGENAGTPNTCECPPPAEAGSAENQETQGDNSAGKGASKKHKKHKKHRKG